MEGMNHLVCISKEHFLPPRGEQVSFVKWPLAPFPLEQLIVPPLDRLILKRRSTLAHRLELRVPAVYNEHKALLIRIIPHLWRGGERESMDPNFNASKLKNEGVAFGKAHAAVGEEEGCVLWEKHWLLANVGQ